MRFVRVDGSLESKRCTSSIQGVPEAPEQFREAISQEPMGLQKRHGCQKMRLILKFCVGILKTLIILIFR
jgi:hypothetical protein